MATQLFAPGSQYMRNPNHQKTPNRLISTPSRTSLPVNLCILMSDPFHRHKRSIVNQREVGIDTDSYEDALHNTLRQAPDVVLIGEIRSRETMEHALAFAETGHLCLCTLHANNANQALDRIQSFFPAELHRQVWMDLSLNLRSMVAQQLTILRQGRMEG